MTLRDDLHALVRPLRIVVTGGRDYVNTSKVAWVLDGLKHAHGITRLAHGNARGLDAIAGRLAKVMGIEVVAYSVDTTLDGPWPAAGQRRNRRMLESEVKAGGIDLVVAFRGGRGTEGCKATARRMGLRVWEADLS